MKNERCFTESEMTTLLRSAKRRASRGTIIDRADFALITFAYASGCRVSEIATTSLDSNDPNHLNLKTGTLRITDAKYQSSGIVPIDVTSLRNLRWYVREIRPRLRNAGHLNHLFMSKVGRPYRSNTLTQKIALMLARFGFDHLTAHGFRHYFVTSMLRRGSAPHVVQALARHRDARTTLSIYAHASVDDLKAAVNRRAC